MLYFTKNLRERLILRQVELWVERVLRLKRFQLQLGRGTNLVSLALRFFWDLDLQVIIAGRILNHEATVLVRNAIHDLLQFGYRQAEFNQWIA